MLAPMLVLLLLPAVNWEGKASIVSINTVNGNVTVTRSPDANVHVGFRGRNVDPNEHVRVVRDGRQITICEVYRSDASPGARCPGSGDLLGLPERSQRVDFELALPPATEARLTTVNGDVRATTESPITIVTVNGAIEAECSSGARLTSTNGDVALDLTSPRWDGLTDVRSTNGQIRVNLAVDVDTEMDLESNARPFRGHESYRLHLTRGHGRSALEVHSVSGSIVIREGATIIAQTER